MKLYCSWEALKNIKNDSSSNFYYYECPCRYEILTIVAETVWYTQIWKAGEFCAGIDTDKNSASLLDFEQNFKSDAQLL